MVGCLIRSTVVNKSYVFVRRDVEALEESTIEYNDNKFLSTSLDGQQFHVKPF